MVAKPTVITYYTFLYSNTRTLCANVEFKSNWIYLLHVVQLYLEFKLSQETNKPDNIIYTSNDNGYIYYLFIISRDKNFVSVYLYICYYYFFEMNVSYVFFLFIFLVAM